MSEAAELEQEAPAGEFDDDDQEERPPRDDAATARRIAGYLIIGGCVLAAGCLIFIVWEQWRANQAALELRSNPFSDPLAGFPVVDGPGSTPPPDPGPQAQPGLSAGEETAEGGPLEE